MTGLRGRWWRSSYGAGCGVHAVAIFVDLARQVIEVTQQEEDMYYIGHRAYLSSPINSHLIVFPNRLAILNKMWRRYLQPAFDALTKPWSLSRAACRCDLNNPSREASELHPRMHEHESLLPFQSHAD
jgi:hypothetical protein